MIDFDSIQIPNHIAKNNVSNLTCVICTHKQLAQIKKKGCISHKSVSTIQTNDEEKVIAC